MRNTLVLEKGLDTDRYNWVVKRFWEDDCTVEYRYFTTKKEAKEYIKWQNT